MGAGGGEGGRKRKENFVVSLFLSFFFVICFFCDEGSAVRRAVVSVVVSAFLSRSVYADRCVADVGGNALGWCFDRGGIAQGWLTVHATSGRRRSDTVVVPAAARPGQSYVLRT